MILRYLDLKPHPGGKSKITAVVDSDIGRTAKELSQAIFKPEEYELTISKIKKKRSNDANAYYWKLVDKLAAALGSTKQEVHSQLLGDYGTIKTDDTGEIVTLLIKRGQDPTQYVDYPTYLADYTVGTETYAVYGVCKGSSEMDSHEFSKLLDGAIYECKELGLEVLSDIELKRLMESLK